MKMLIYGAGVMGSLYGGVLHYSGQDVTILARGRRFNDLTTSGIVLHDVESNDWMYFRVPTVDRLDPYEKFDVIVVLVQRQQLSQVLPTLQAYRHPATILVMSPNAIGYEEWTQQIGRERLLIGHAGAGGRIEGYVVHYRIASPHFQRTMIGDVDGSNGFRVRQVASILKKAGFPLAVSSDMLAWHRCHLAWVCPLAQAVRIAGNGKALAEDEALLLLLIRAMEEGIRVLHSLEVRILPFELRLLKWLPERVLVRNMQRFAQSAPFRELVEAHPFAAPGEMRFLADEFRQFASESPLDTPAMNELSQAATVIYKRADQGILGGRLVA